MWRVNRCLLCHESREGTGSTAILGERVRLGGSPNFEGVLVSPLRPVVDPAACFEGQTRAHDALEVADSLSGRLGTNANGNSHLRPLLPPPTRVSNSLFIYLFMFPYHLVCSPYCSSPLPFVRISGQPLGHIAGTYLPSSPSTVRAFISCRDKSSALFSSLVDSRRMVNTHAATTVGAIC